MATERMPEETKMKALILTGRLVQDQEFIYPLYRLQEAGYEVDVSVGGREPVLGYFGTKIVPTVDFPGVYANDYEVLILPGGVKAMEHMRQRKELIDFIQAFHHTRKVIGSICSAAQLLISADIVRDNIISGYYAMADDIVNAGATYVDAPAVVDDHIVTSPHYKHLGPWMKAVLEEVDRCKTIKTS